MKLLYISILWLAVCVDSISAAVNITVSAQIGSTATLPCSLSNVPSQTPYIQWITEYELVFERSNGTFTSPNYLGRVDVPENQLRQGMCSMVLKNVKLTDDSFYKTYVVKYADRANPTKWTEINRVKLSVDVVQVVPARVGSTVLLPCKWKNLSIDTPFIEWNTDREVVFERSGKEAIWGKGYEGRVDVPEDELLKGNCSLVLKNVSVTDAAVYTSGMVVKETSETVLVQKLKLSVSGDDGINCPHLLILIISILVFTLQH